MDTVPKPPSTPPGAPAPTIQQYALYVQDLGNVGTRYTNTNGFYLSVITALLGILALAKPAEGLVDLQSVLRLVVPLFAGLVCWVWFHTLAFYRSIFKAKFEVLREFEQGGGFFPAYEREWERLRTGRAPWLIANEERIPLLLFLPFLVVLIYAVLKMLRWI